MQAKSLASSTCLHSKLRGISTSERTGFWSSANETSTLLIMFNLSSILVQSEHNIADLLTKSHTTRYQQLLGKIGDKANIRHLRNESIKLQAASLRLLLELHGRFHGPGRLQSLNTSKFLRSAVRVSRMYMYTRYMYIG